MTDREAIVKLEEFFEWLGGISECTSCDDSIAVALSALKEREERRKGCEFCRNKDDDSLWEPGGAHDFRLYQDGIFYYDQEFGWEGTTIRFCPWCGRVLKKAMPGEEV